MGKIDSYGTIEDAKPQAERIMLYGVAGSGKTTFSADAPNPYFIDLNRGLGHVRRTRKIASNAKTIASWQAFLELIHAFATESHTYETLVIDTLGEAEQMCFVHLCEVVGKAGKDGRSRIKVGSFSEVNGGYGREYDALVDEFRRLVAAVNRCWERGMHVILIAHARQEKVPNQAGPDWKRWAPALQPRVTEVLAANCDEVFFASRNTIVTKDRNLFGDDRYRAIGGESYVMVTQDTPSVMAKQRCGLPAQLPLDWDAFAKAAAEGHTPALLEATVRDKARRLGRADVWARVERVLKDSAGDAKALSKVCSRLDAMLDEAAQASASAPSTPEPPSPESASEDAADAPVGTN